MSSSLGWLAVLLVGVAVGALLYRDLNRQERRDFWIMLAAVAVLIVGSAVLLTFLLG